LLGNDSVNTFPHDGYAGNNRLTSVAIQRAANTTIEEERFSMWSAPRPLLGNESLNTFLQKQTRGTIEFLLLGNGTVNMPSQQKGNQGFLWVRLESI
jgi:hypothetical protein